MNTLRHVPVLLLSLVVALPDARGASLGLSPCGPSVQAGDDLPQRAHDLLVERCASCHAPDADDPKAIRGWGDARDLAATVANEELIVPGSADDSWLYAQIEDGEMPPSDCDIPALNAEEQAIIASWIDRGANLPAPVAVEAPSRDQPATAEGTSEPLVDGGIMQPKVVPWMKSPLFKWIGRFHPVIVHFPLALFAAALAAEVLSKLLRKPELRVAATFSMTIGTLASVPSVACGWLLAESTIHRGNDIDYHRWIGVAVAVIAVLGLRAFYTRPALRLPILLTLAALAGITGHLGGSLVYGSDWLKPPF